MTTTAPDDLLLFRSGIEAATGIADATALGIQGDRRHQATGGYHLGASDLIAIGRYHPPAHLNVGKSTEDYSARYARDRDGLTEYASAIDVDEQWPNGGRAAWIRWNNLVVAELRAASPASPLTGCVRAVNTTLDGINDRRFDVTSGWTAEATSDHGHTHVEFWRDTQGTAHRALAVQRLLVLMHQAISGGTMAHTIDDLWDLISGIVDGLPKPDGVPSAVPQWVQSTANKDDIKSLAAAIQNLADNVHSDFVALQQNPPVPPSAAAIAGEIIKQLGLTPK